MPLCPRPWQTKKNPRQTIAAEKVFAFAVKCGCDSNDRLVAHCRPWHAKHSQNAASNRIHTSHKAVCGRRGSLSR